MCLPSLIIIIYMIQWRGENVKKKFKKEINIEKAIWILLNPSQNESLCVHVLLTFVFRFYQHDKQSTNINKMEFSIA